LNTDAVTSLFPVPGGAIPPFFPGVRGLLGCGLTRCLVPRDLSIFIARQNSFFIVFCGSSSLAEASFLSPFRYGVTPHRVTYSLPPAFRTPCLFRCGFHGLPLGPFSSSNLHFCARSPFSGFSPLSVEGGVRACHPGPGYESFITAVCPLPDFASCF